MLDLRCLTCAPLTHFFNNKESFLEFEIEIVIILGMVLLIFILGIISLFSPINTLIQKIIAVGAVLIFACLNKDIFALVRKKLSNIKTSFFSSGILFVLFILAVLYSVGGNVLINSGLYHLQAIRWIETYPAVPGLANLHSRFGFNSNWLLLEALFGFSNIGHPLYHLPELAISLVFISYVIEKSNKLKKSASTTNLIFFGFLLYGVFLLFRQYGGFEISSPGTDLPSMLLTWFIFLIALDIFTTQNWAAFSVLVVFSIF